MEHFLAQHLYVFPKLDGANASIWLDKDGELHYGSSNRDLSLKDEAFRGFKDWVDKHKEQFTAIIETFSSLHGIPCTIYGEWLVPHTVKNYNEDMWHKFWIFDVTFESETDNLSYISHKAQQQLIVSKEAYPYLIPCLQEFPAGINNKDLTDLPSLNKFGITVDGGFGEGVVLKCYDVPVESWMKVIHDDFANKVKVKRDKAPVNTEREKQIVDNFMGGALIEKEYAKLMFEDPEMPKGQLIGRLLNRVYQSFIEDNMWAIIKKFKNLSINFRVLQKIINDYVKEYKSELF